MSHALTRTHVIAPKQLIEEVDRIVGPRHRSEFITDAVAEKLKREKLLQATRRAMSLPAVDDVPEWKTPEAVSKWVHDQRVDNKPIRKV
jgi:metal-responsive CopG/Arc/MetJ family transcriptional regulator